MSAVPRRGQPESVWRGRWGLRAQSGKTLLPESHARATYTIGLAAWPIHTFINSSYARTTDSISLAAWPTRTFIYSSPSVNGWLGVKHQITNLLSFRVASIISTLWRLTLSRAWWPDYLGVSVIHWTLTLAQIIRSFSKCVSTELLFWHKSYGLFLSVCPLNSGINYTVFL